MSDNSVGTISKAKKGIRICKPPGSYTNDIFGLESRQKLQDGRVYFGNETFKENFKDGVEAYAGITDKTRVRKPPGGDTHDIFDMESRQRSQAAENNTMIWNELQAMKDQNEKKAFYNMDEPLNNYLQEEAFEQPILHSDQENDSLISDGGSDIENSFNDESPNSNVSRKKYLVRNPITGEVTEMIKTPKPSKLEDILNITPCGVQKPEEKSIVRVRQPPGGMSSFLLF